MTCDPTRPGSPAESEFRMLGVPSRATTKDLSHSAAEMHVQVAPLGDWGSACALGYSMYMDICMLVYMLVTICCRLVHGLLDI